jgi:Domain of unknown function (DUF4157)
MFVQNEGVNSYSCKDVLLERLQEPLHSASAQNTNMKRQIHKADQHQTQVLNRENWLGSTLQAPLTDIANNGLQARQLKAYQALANPKTSNTAQLKGLLNIGQETLGIVQKKENLHGLPTQLRQGIESLSGMDMSDVRVHRNSAKPAQLQAHAYAQGREIHLGPGQEQHLPHEAWHIVQQAQGRVKPTLQMKGIAINDDQHLEKEADQMGAQAAQLRATNEGVISNHPVQQNMPHNSLFANHVQRAAFVTRSLQTAPIMQLKLEQEDAFELYRYYLTRYSGVTPWLTWQPTHRQIVLQFDDLAEAKAEVDRRMEVLMKTAADGSSGPAASKAPAAASASISAPTAAAAASIASASAAAAEEEVEERTYGDGKGISIEASRYEKLRDLIRAYDVNLDADFKRGSAMGATPLTSIGVGLAELATYIEQKTNKDLKRYLDHLIHPGVRDYTRNEKYGGRSFMQILAMCAKGNECHNDLAQALMECLDVLKLED